jgi:hypothetical protein
MHSLTAFSRTCRPRRGPLHLAADGVPA